MHSLQGLIIDICDYEIGAKVGKFEFENEEYTKFQTIVKNNQTALKNHCEKIFNEAKVNANIDEILTTLKDMKAKLDKQQYREIIKQYEPELEEDDKGNFGETYNPHGICDWYDVGGRWAGYLSNGKDNRYRYSLKEFKHYLKYFQGAYPPNGLIINGEYYFKENHNIIQMIMDLPDNKDIVIIDMHL
jgi:hypothetical protein